ncbi:DUF3973 domain-containing protein [Ammoniphilus sp. 3BR4]|uniref:DUF3973 domain-containing protein n=1 Tax=Ammoniphilus sp. 3BR4 TaxID=3158265 RepID=UPI003464FFAE
MYYCLECKEYHPKSTVRKILNTGFRTEDSNRKNVPLGFCEKAHFTSTHVTENRV